MSQVRLSADLDLEFIAELDIKLNDPRFEAEVESSNVNVEFLSAYTFDIIEKNGLRKDDLNTQIESDIRDGRNIVLDEPSFKVFLDSLQ